MTKPGAAASSVTARWGFPVFSSASIEAAAARRTARAAAAPPRAGPRRRGCTSGTSLARESRRRLARAQELLLGRQQLGRVDAQQRLAPADRLPAGVDEQPLDPARDLGVHLADPRLVGLDLADGAATQPGEHCGTRSASLVGGRMGRNGAENGIAADGSELSRCQQSGAPASGWPVHSEEETPK